MARESFIRICRNCFANRSESKKIPSASECRTITAHNAAQPRFTPARVRNKLRLGVLVTSIAAIIAMPSAAFAVRTLGLSSGTFKFNVSAGDVHSDQVIVVNSGDEPLKVMVYVSDQSVNEKGKITYSAPTRADLSSLASPATWTRVTMPANSKALGNIPYVELKPGQRVPVKFTVAVPSTVAPGDHNVLIFFESFELPVKGSGARTQVSGRIGTRVTLRVSGTVFERLEVRPFSVPSFVIGKDVPYQFLVRNIGNLDQRVGAKVMLLDRSDNEVTSLTGIDGATVFANKNLEETGTLAASGLPVGPFKVRIDVTQVDDTGNAVEGGAKTITEVRDVMLAPLWLLIALGVLALALVFALIWKIAASTTRSADSRKAKKAAAASAGEKHESAAVDESYYDPEQGD